VINGQRQPIHLHGGWNCWDHSDGSSPDRSLNLSRPRLHSSYKIGTTYVNPNAHCPVCGAGVFFYRSPDEGRVFFDELGPPWPKHACTDQGLEHPMIRRSLEEFIMDESKKPRQNIRRKLAPRWIAAGFTAFSLTRGELSGTGIRIYGTVFDKDGKRSKPLLIRIRSHHSFRKYEHEADLQLMPWREIRAERGIILRAADNGLMMIRQEIESSSVLISIMSSMPSSSRASASQIEIIEVQGEVEIDNIS